MVAITIPVSFSYTPSNRALALLTYDFAFENRKMFLVLWVLELSTEFSLYDGEKFFRDNWFVFTFIRLAHPNDSAAVERIREHLMHAALIHFFTGFIPQPRFCHCFRKGFYGVVAS